MELAQHPLAKRYRLFSDGEMVRLRESVARLGVIEPVTLLDGLVLDGWHRLQVSHELGVECPSIEYSGKEEDIGAWLAAKNEARRHCSDMQFAMMVAADSPQRPGRGRPQKTLTAVNVSAKTDKLLAAEHGIQPNMLATARRVLASGDDELIAEATGGSLGRTEARKRLRELKAARLTAEQLARPSAARSDVVVSDVADLLSHVAPASVAAVITDPPWSEMKAWEDLARVSAQILKPGGVLVAMAGKHNLPDVLDRLRAGAEGTDLRYAWTMCCVLPRLTNPLPGVRFQSGWYPLLVMSRGRRSYGFCPDRVDSDRLDGKNLKSHHPWEKDIAGFKRLVEWFAAPGELVVDPFIGGGTTGVAALQTGRAFVGCDIDPRCVDIAARRLNGLEAAA